MLFGSGHELVSQDWAYARGPTQNKAKRKIRIIGKNRRIIVKTLYHFRFFHSFDTLNEVKKYLFVFLLSLIVFILRNPTPVSANCIKATGNNVLCIGDLKCPVGQDIYCCWEPNAQSDCAALQKQVQPTCFGLGGMCHLQSDTCQTDLGQADCPQFQTCSANCSISTLNSVSETCNFIKDATENTKCVKCTTNGAGAWTAIGCIKTDISGFFSTLLTFGISIAGGIAFLLILLGGFQILTSAGNPEQLNAGKELVGSAITGLLLIIFSVFFLKIIGVDILGLPGWRV